MSRAGVSTVVCASCRKPFGVSAEFAGRDVQCPWCRHVYRIRPREEPATPIPPPPPPGTAPKPPSPWRGEPRDAILFGVAALLLALLPFVFPVGALVALVGILVAVRGVGRHRRRNQPAATICLVAGGVNLVGLVVAAVGTVSLIATALERSPQTVQDDNPRPKPPPKKEVIEPGLDPRDVRRVRSFLGKLFENSAIRCVKVRVPGERDEVLDRMMEDHFTAKRPNAVVLEQVVYLAGEMRLLKPPPERFDVQVQDALLTRRDMETQAGQPLRRWSEQVVLLPGRNELRPEKASPPNVHVLQESDGSWVVYSRDAQIEAKKATVTWFAYGPIRFGIPGEAKEDDLIRLISMTPESLADE